jgi:hypothetical protein
VSRSGRHSINSVLRMSAGIGEALPQDHTNGRLQIAERDMCIWG